MFSCSCPYSLETISPTASNFDLDTLTRELSTFFGTVYVEFPVVDSIIDLLSSGVFRMAEMALFRNECLVGQNWINFWKLHKQQRVLVFLWVYLRWYCEMDVFVLIGTSFWTLCLASKRSILVGKLPQSTTPLELPPHLCFVTWRAPPRRS